MPLRIQLGGEDSPHYPIPVDYEGDPAGDQAERPADAVQIRNPPSGVAEQEKPGPAFARKPPMALLGICADAYDLRSQRGQALVARAEGSCFRGAPGGEVLRIEVQDDVLLP